MFKTCRYTQLHSLNKYLRECIKTHHFDIRNTKIFWRGTPSPEPTTLGVFSAQPPVPLSDGTDTRPCKILDPPMTCGVLKIHIPPGPFLGKGSASQEYAKFLLIVIGYREFSDVGVMSKLHLNI